jgi:hypothetical protein
MSSVLQAGPCVRTNQLDFDEEVVFKARQYLYDHVRNTPAQPFCLTVSMTHPHDPYTIPAEFWDLYEGVNIPMPSHTMAQDAQDAHSQRLLKVIDLWDKPLAPEAIARARRAYFGACTYVDSKVGELLKTLNACGLGEDTIVVFSGDHGDMLGERGLWYKMHWFEMAARVPLIIHARAADEDMEAILAEGMRAKPYSCVMHCFSSGQRLATAALEMGFYLSMSGIATFPKSSDLRDIFATAPINRILLETDSPYLAPIPHRGKRNEPAYTAFTAKTGAAIYGLTEAEFAAVTTANFDRLFTRAARAAKAA